MIQSSMEILLSEASPQYYPNAEMVLCCNVLVMSLYDMYNIQTRMMDILEWIEHVVRNRMRSLEFKIMHSYV